MPNDRSAPEKVFSYGIGIFGSQIECYRIGDEFFLYGVAEVVEATQWASHTTRGFFAGALKKRLGLTIDSEKDESRGRVYKGQ